jgi:hypothetical protein
VLCWLAPVSIKTSIYKRIHAYYVSAILGITTFLLIWPVILSIVPLDEHSGCDRSNLGSEKKSMRDRGVCKAVSLEVTMT